MSRHERLVRTLLRGRSDANIRFDELRALMRYLGFEERVRGSHHLFDKEGILEIQTGSRRLMHKYEIILYWSNEDQAFVAEAPELPGCMAHGDDQETRVGEHQGCDAVLDRQGTGVGTTRAGAQGRAPDAGLTGLLQPLAHTLRCRTVGDRRLNPAMVAEYERFSRGFTWVRKRAFRGGRMPCTLSAASFGPFPKSSCEPWGRLPQAGVQACADRQAGWGQAVAFGASGHLPSARRVRDRSCPAMTDTFQFGSGRL